MVAEVPTNDDVDVPRHRAHLPSTVHMPPLQLCSPSLMLYRGYGSVMEHAILLCSLLLGSGFDAYVCVGESTLFCFPIFWFRFYVFSWDAQWDHIPDGRWIRSSVVKVSTHIRCACVAVCLGVTYSLPTAACVGGHTDGKQGGAAARPAVRETSPQPIRRYTRHHRSYHSRHC